MEEESAETRTPVRKLSQGFRWELQGRGGLVAVAKARERRYITNLYKNTEKHGKQTHTHDFINQS